MADDAHRLPVSPLKPVRGALAKWARGLCLSSSLGRFRARFVLGLDRSRSDWNRSRAPSTGHVALPRRWELGAPHRQRLHCRRGRANHPDTQCCTFWIVTPLHDSSCSPGRPLGQLAEHDELIGSSRDRGLEQPARAEKGRRWRGGRARVPDLEQPLRLQLCEAEAIDRQSHRRHRGRQRQRPRQQAQVKGGEELDHRAPPRSGSRCR